MQLKPVINKHRHCTEISWNADRIIGLLDETKKTAICRIPSPYPHSAGLGRAIERSRVQFFGHFHSPRMHTTVTWKIKA